MNIHCQNHNVYTKDCKDCKKAYAQHKNESMTEFSVVEKKNLPKDILIQRQVFMKIASNHKTTPVGIVEFAKLLEVEWNKWR